MDDRLDGLFFAGDEYGNSWLFAILLFSAIASGVVLLGEFSPDEPNAPGPVDEQEQGMIEHHPG